MVVGNPVLRVTVPQLSLTVGGTNEEVGLAGLQPNVGSEVVPVRIGLTTSVVQLMV